MSDDRRLLVVESEMVSAFKVASREGNTLSAILRAAWDDGTLRTLTRNSPLTATGAHISVIGHITSDELLRHLNSTEAANGYANRFLWIAVKRSKLLPDGGAGIEPGAMAACTDKLRAALAFGRKAGLLERDSAARDLWHRSYATLAEGEPGLVGSLLARSEAQVLRLSLVYALLDRSATIREQHLRAALALWDYADRSTRFLFGHQSGNRDAATIASALAKKKSLTKTEISGLFHRHRSAPEIERATEELIRKEWATWERVETAGRPVLQLSSLDSLLSRPTDWPDPPSEEAYYGLAGDIVRLIEPSSEADPVALLVQLLVGFGNAMGRTPYVSVESDRHHTNLFAVIVGDTAKARKGTSWGRARKLLVEADPEWGSRIMGGLSSGEGLIAQVADSERSENGETRGAS